MKKKVAVFASGWGDEYFREVVSGISEAATKENVDTKNIIIHPSCKTQNTYIFKSKAKKNFFLFFIYCSKATNTIYCY